ncbi:MAG TPA: hypothetical protein VK658_01030 [Chryseolinea sp.]|nr:hypothetical protein [Chryseolinea sp.]
MANQQIALFKDGGDDLLRIDLGFLNMRFISAESQSFSNEIDVLYGFTSPAHNELHSYRNTMLKDEVSNNAVGEYILIPINKDIEVTTDTLLEVYYCLNLICPSYFGLHCIIRLHEFKQGCYSEGYMTSDHRYTPHYARQFGYIMPFKLPNIDIDTFNAGLQRRLEMLLNGFPFRLFVNSYSVAYTLSNIPMAFVSLMISLESLTSTTKKIKETIASTCAMLNADNEAEGIQIYQMTKHLYQLRSEIVHGDEKLSVERNDFLYLMALLMETFNSLIELNFSSKAELNDFAKNTKPGDRLQRYGSATIPTLNPANRRFVVSGFIP